MKKTFPPFLSLYLKEVTGVENIPEKGPFIIAANHASYFDHLLISSVLVKYKNLYPRFLAKKEHFDTPFQKVWHEIVEAIPIDREKNWKEGLSKAEEELQKGAIIGIYPEGTRSSDGKLHKGKLGVARLALFAKVPVLPIGLIDTHKILPKESVIPKGRRARIKIGVLMKFDKYFGKEEDLKTLRETTTQIMCKIGELIDQPYDY